MSEKPRQIRETKGRDLFRRWLGPKSHNTAATELGISLNLLRRWLDGSRRPSLDMAVVIERHTGGAVPAADWADEEEIAKAIGE